MKKKILFILLMITVVCVTACTEPYEELPGVVYQKEIKPEEVANKEDNNSSKTYEYTYPERYVLYVKYDLGDGEYSVEAFYVSKTIYDSSNIGDEYYYNSEKDKIEEPYISRKEVE